MYARRQRAYRLTPQWWDPDPDDLEAFLKAIYVRTGSDIADSVWHHLRKFDFADLMRLRRRQIMWLAKYGRQSLFAWEDRPVTELNFWASQLLEVLEAENPIARAGDE